MSVSIPLRIRAFSHSTSASGNPVIPAVSISFRGFVLSHGGLGLNRGVRGGGGFQSPSEDSCFLTITTSSSCRRPSTCVSIPFRGFVLSHRWPVTPEAAPHLLYVSIPFRGFVLSHHLLEPLQDGEQDHVGFQSPSEDSCFLTGGLLGSAPALPGFVSIPFRGFVLSHPQRAEGEAQMLARFQSPSEDSCFLTQSARPRTASACFLFQSPSEDSCFLTERADDRRPASVAFQSPSEDSCFLTQRYQRPSAHGWDAFQSPSEDSCFLTHEHLDVIPRAVIGFNPLPRIRAFSP